MKRRPSIAVQVWRYFVHYKLTPPGRMLVAMVILSSVGAISMEIMIYQVFCGLIAFLGISEILGTFLRPKLQVEGWLPEQTTAGEQARGQLFVRNVGWFPTYDIMAAFVGLPHGVRHVDADLAIKSLSRGERTSLPVTLEAFDRGVAELPEIMVHSTFPFNLMRFGVNRHQPRPLTVLPAFQRLESFAAPASQRYQPGGAMIESRLGQSPEYVGNREYIPGEPARRLDFRAWARLGRPVVREYQDEFCSRVAIILDTGCDRSFRRTRKHAPFEAAVSLTASIAQALHDTEAIIDVFAAGPELYIFQAIPGLTHFDSVLEILASVDLTGQDPLDKISPAVLESMESISLAICVLLDWNDSREQLAQRILEAGCGLKIIIVRDGATTRPVPSQFDNHVVLTPESIQQGEVRRL